MGWYGNERGQSIVSQRTCVSCVQDSCSLLAAGSNKIWYNCITIIYLQIMQYHLWVTWLLNTIVCMYVCMSPDLGFSGVKSRAEHFLVYPFCRASGKSSWNM